MSTALTKPERSVLAVCEAEIERGLNNFVEVGNALLRIRNERLYRSEFGTFQEYCESRWDLSKTHANRMIQAAEITENLTPMGVKPSSERVGRPLANLPADVQRKAWGSAVDSSASGTPTEKEVAAAVEVVAPKKREQINYTPANGLQYAQMAIDSLEKIQPTDTQRTRAFQKVKNWIAQQEAK